MITASTSFIMKMSSVIVMFRRWTGSVLFISPPSRGDILRFLYLSVFPSVCLSVRHYIFETLYIFTKGLYRVRVVFDPNCNFNHITFFCDRYHPKCPKVEIGSVRTCGFENINKFILTHIYPCTSFNSAAIRLRQNQNLLHFCLK